MKWLVYAVAFFLISFNCFAQAPVVSSFTPASGPIGATVTITGVNFDDFPANNTVFFGATKATVNSASSTQLTVTVPAGANYQLISVLVNSKIGYSKNPFTVTFGGVIAPNSYAPHRDFGTGTLPYAVAVGDLNQDGQAEIVTANHNDNTLTIYRNTSPGPRTVTYSSAGTLVTGTNPISVAIGDLDGDGKLDIATTNYADNTVSTFRNLTNSGSISFDDKQSFSTAGNPQSVVIGDLDLDGKADLATANYSGNSVSVLLNTSPGVGSISFGTKVDLTGQSGTFAIAIGDLTEDGLPDLVATNYFGTNVSAFKNTSSPGTLSFDGEVLLTTGSTPYGISVADVDGDGIGDIIVANQGDATVSVFRNTTVSNVISFDSKVDFGTGVDPNSVAAGDADGDGKVDLLVVNQNQGTISVLTNTGSIGTINFATKVDFKAGADPKSVAMGDADNDGKADLFVANGGDNSVSVLHYGPPPAISSFTPSSGAVGATVTINGLNFDPTPSNNIVYFGATKGVVSGGNSGQLSVVVPAGATYEPITVITNGLTAYSAYPFITTFSGGTGMTGSSYSSPADINTSLSSSAIFVGDLDGDGKADAVTVNPTDASFTVFVNNSPAGAISFTHSTSGTSTDALDVALSDLDGDGRPDIIMTNVGDDRISIYENTSTPGSFSFGTTSEYAYAGNNPYGLAVADFDNDGKNDLAVANSADNTVSVVRNITNGTNGITFATSIDYATGTFPQAVATGDFDGDGKTDIAVVNYQDNTVSVFRNMSSAPGIINFTSKLDYSVGLGPVSIAAGDLNNDLKIDLVVANHDGNNMTTLSNQSPGPSDLNMGGSTNFTTGTTPESVAINDLNGDGKPDVVVANSESNSFSVFVNTNTAPGSLSLAGRIDYGTGSGPKAAAIGDFDGDGKNDVVVTNSNDQTFSAYRRVIPAAIPTISFLNPESGPVGSFVIIGGTNFDPIASNNTVKFNGVTGSPSASTATTINIKVPAGATTGFVTVTVGGNTATSNKVFTVGAPKTVSTADSVALVALYNSASGSGWTNKTNWLTGPANTWYGVSTDASRVSSLNLAGNNLNGSIPSAIGNLTQITVLDLSGNKLSGSIPSNVGNLVNLTSLLLHNNQLSGSIPTEFNNLDLLSSFSINNNSISNLPNLTGMASLTSLDANGNQLEFDDIIPNIGITNFFYCCQKNVSEGHKVALKAGNSLSLSASVGGVGNAYQWRKNGNNISGAIANSYSVTTPSLLDVGNYSLVITNPGAPGLTLTTTDFQVEIYSAEAGNYDYQFWKKLGAEALGISEIRPGGRVSIDDLGNYYFVSSTDMSNGTVIQKSGPSGNLLYTITSGNGDIAGTDIAIDAQNSVYVPGPDYSTMRKYNSSGALVFETPVYGGSRPFQAIAIDIDESILAMESSGASYVKRFDNATGNFVEQISFTGGPVSYYTSVFDLDIDASGNIYVPDGTRIDKYSSAGVFISSFDVSMAGGWGALILQVADNGHLYVSAWYSGNTIYHFDDTGNFVNKFGIGYGSLSSLTISSSDEIITGSAVGIYKYDLNGNFLGFAEPRNANGQFSYAAGIANDSKGNRYVSDRFNHRIQKFNGSGNFITAFGTQGNGNGQFNNPLGIAVDESDNLFVVDNGNNRIQKFSPSGVYQLTIGSAGSANGQFTNPQSVTISSTGDVFVADAGNYRIQKFTSGGSHILSFGSQGTNPDQFTNLSGLSLEDDGNVLASDGGKVKRFAPDGTFINELDLSGYGVFGSLATDKLGKFYAANGNLARKLDKQGALITNVGSAGSANGQFNVANVVSSNTAGDTLWVADYYRNRISVFYARNLKISSTDSLALVTLYNATNGADWTNRTNWLTGNVETWFGVTIQNNRVTGLKLPSNNLKGTLPPQLGDLIRLKILNLSGNSISGALPSQVSNLTASKQIILNNNKLTDLINLSALPALDTLFVQNNQLTFEDLEPNIPIPVFQYSPQDSIDTKESVLREIAASQTFTASIGGSSNVYQWKKNGSAITGATTTSLNFPAITIDDDAEYNYEATNSVVPGLTLLSNKKILRVSSLRRDSLALCALFKAAGGEKWINSANWINTPLGTGNWFGVTISNNRVSALNLPNNNLTGSVPQIVADVLNLTALDLFNNKIEHLPDLRALAALGALNVSNNHLDFASLIPNSAITGVNYQNQADIGLPSKELVDFGTNYTVKVSTKGVGNQYQWKRNGTVVEGATDSTYVIASIGRANMGDYVSEIMNPAVPDLKLKTASQTVLAVATLSGRLKVSDTDGASKGIVRLFRIQATGGYDTLQTKEVNDLGEYRFEKVVLDDYQISGFADTLNYAGALPTYYESTILWEEADTLFVNSNLIDLDIVSNFKPTGVDKGVGIISGRFEEEEKTDGRTEAAKRVSGAGASVRRVEGAARPMADKLILVAYVFTNDNGEFVMPDLPKGNYRLNIQYPGYPMDETSFINMTIGDGLQSQVRVAARVEDNKIKVDKLVVTGLWEEKGYSANAYPNPTASSINLQFGNESASRKINLIDMTGREIHTQAAEGKSCSVNVQSLNTGIYLLNVYESDIKVKSIRVSVER